MVRCLSFAMALNIHNLLWVTCIAYIHVSLSITFKQFLTDWKK